MKKIIMVKGTHCPACKALIEDVSTEVKGVIDCSVDYKSGKVEIEHDNSFNIGEFKKKIEELGAYKVVA